MKRLKDERGLTLVELLAVLVILGIIAAIAIPSIGGIIQNSKEDAVKADAIAILEAAKLYKIQKPDETSSNFSVADLDDYVDLPSKSSLNDATVDFSKDTVEISTAEAVKAGNRTLKFSGATIEEINEHESGSDVTTIGE